MSFRAFATGLALLSVTGCQLQAPAPSIGDGRVVVQRGFVDELTIVDASLGKPVAVLGTDGYASAPPMRFGIFFTHGDGGLVARNVSDGQAVWRQLVKAPYYAPLVLGGESVFAYQTSPGKPRWIGFAASSGRSTFDVPCDRGAPLAAAGDYLATFQEGRLVVRSAEDGKERLRLETELEAPILATPEKLFARAGDDLAVIKIESGRVERLIRLESSEAFAVSDGHTPRLAVSTDLLAVAAEGAVRVFDIQSGKLRFSTAFDEALLVATGAGVVVAAGGSSLLVLDSSSGAKRASVDLGAEARGLTLAEGLVAVRSDDALHLIDLATGRLRHRVELRP